MMPPQFIFINKHGKSQSLSHSDKTERVKIHSHVQLARKAQTPQILGRKGDDINVQKQTAPTKPHIHKWHSGRKPSVRKKHNKEDTSKRNSTSIGSGTDSASDEADVKSYKFSSFAESVITKPPHSISAVDPFDTSCVKVDSEVQRLLTYYLYHAHPNTYYPETRFSQKAKDSFHNDAKAIVKKSFDDEANMYTLLASMASRMRYLENYEDQHDSSPLISKAIAAIQKKLREDSPMTQRSVFNLFHLGTAEFYRWDVASSLVHLKALNVVVKNFLGGLKRLDHPLAELLFLGDGYVAAELGTKPLYSPAELDEDSEALTPKEGIVAMKKLADGTKHVACGLLAPDQRDIIPTELRWIILDMAVCLCVLQDHTVENGSKDAPADVLHWVHLRNLAIRHRLMSLEFDDQRSRALRLALLIWDLLVYTVAGRKRTAKVVAAQLRDCLAAIPIDAWVQHEAIHLWMLSVGAMSTSEGNELHAWYVEEAASAIEAADDSQPVRITSFEALRSLELDFLYHEFVQKKSLMRLWNRVVKTIRQTQEDQH